MGEVRNSPSPSGFPKAKTVVESAFEMGLLPAENPMLRIIAIVVLLSCLMPASAQVAVINADVSEKDIDLKRINMLLLGRSTIWADGSPVTLVMAVDPSADLHLSHVTGRDRSLLMRGWKRLVFAGSGSMPLEATSAENALELVARTKGAVVLLDSAPQDPRWKVIPIMVTAER